MRPPSRGPGPHQGSLAALVGNRAAPVREAARQSPAGARNPIRQVVRDDFCWLTIQFQTRPLGVGIGGPVGSGKTALVEAATFSPELADLTIIAPSIKSWRDAQHAPLRAARRRLIYGPKEGDSR